MSQGKQLFISMLSDNMMYSNEAKNGITNECFCFNIHKRTYYIKSKLETEYGYRTVLSTIQHL